MSWQQSLVAITVSLPDGTRLARCSLERTPGGWLALQEEKDPRGHRLERVYSLTFDPERIWRRREDGAQLTDEELGEEVVAWTYALAQLKEAAR